MNVMKEKTYVWSKLAFRHPSRSSFRLTLISPTFGLVHGLEAKLATLTLLEDGVLHLAELLHDHLDAAGIYQTALCQKTLERKKLSLDFLCEKPFQNKAKSRHLTEYEYN
jgi:hypothetical protein